MHALNRIAARGGHLFLYFLLFALPLTGWALVSSSPLEIPTMLYGIVPWPHLPVFSTLPDKASVEAVLKPMHAIGAYILIAFVVLHAAAAMHHHFVIKDDILRRMLPRARSRATTTATSVKNNGPFS